MKKIVLLASLFIMAISCNSKPGGNHGIIPVTHEPVQVPSHDEHHGAHDSLEAHGDAHATHEEAKVDSAKTTEAHAPEKVDSTTAKH